uniref:Uncharacterized protein n=1 Tax=Rhizophora mucronata TaxID=61149 RepID=A0A2P2PJA3_RHIMU
MDEMHLLKRITLIIQQQEINSKELAWQYHHIRY